jgi:ABC-2 type transport system ATP-binding protein
VPIIEVESLSKQFQQPKRFRGALGAVRTLLTREYTTRMAVDRVSFAIDEGEAVGYVGPNGAGKSTTIKMLTGILVPTSGVVRVMGRIPHQHRRENARNIGVVFGQRSQLWWDLPVRDSYELHQHVYDIPRDRFRDNLAFCREVLELDAFIDSPVRQLSLGQRMRAEMALALLHEPAILFLDEPTIGLDVLAKDRIREFLKTINRERDVTIILTTHDLKDIEEICPRLIVINFGQAIFDGTVSDLRARLGNQRLVKVEFEHDPGPIDLPGAELVSDDGARKTFRFNRSETSALNLLSSLSGRFPVSDVSLEEVGIEEVIRRLYRDMGRDTPEVSEASELDTWTRGRVVTH